MKFERLTALIIAFAFLCTQCGPAYALRAQAAGENKKTTRAVGLALGVPESAAPAIGEAGTAGEAQATGGFLGRLRGLLPGRRGKTAELAPAAVAAPQPLMDIPRFTNRAEGIEGLPMILSQAALGSRVSVRAISAAFPSRGKKPSPIWVEEQLNRTGFQPEPGQAKEPSKDTIYVKTTETKAPEAPAPVAIPETVTTGEQEAVIAKQQAAIDSAVANSNKQLPLTEADFETSAYSMVFGLNARLANAVLRIDTEEREGVFNQTLAREKVAWLDGPAVLGRPLDDTEKQVLAAAFDNTAVAWPATKGPTSLRVTLFGRPLTVKTVATDDARAFIRINHFFLFAPSSPFMFGQEFFDGLLTDVQAGRVDIDFLRQLDNFLGEHKFPQAQALRAELTMVLRCQDSAQVAAMINSPQERDAFFEYLGRCPQNYRGTAIEVLSSSSVIWPYIKQDPEDFLAVCERFSLLANSPNGKYARGCIDVLKESEEEYEGAQGLISKLKTAVWPYADYVTVASDMMNSAPLRPNENLENTIGSVADAVTLHGRYKINARRTAKIGEGKIYVDLHISQGEEIPRASYGEKLRDGEVVTVNSSNEAMAAVLEYKLLASRNNSFYCLIVNIDGSYIGEPRISYSYNSAADIEYVLRGPLSQCRNSGDKWKIQKRATYSTDLKIAPVSSAARAAGSFYFSKEEVDGHTIYTVHERNTGTSFSILSTFGANMIEMKRGDHVIIKRPENLSDLVQDPFAFGMPVLFPFPGRVTDDEFTFDGRRCRFEPNVGEQFRHGLVADKIWEVERYGVSEEGAYITCSIDSQNYPGIEPTIQQQFPFPFKLSITYILKNDGSTAIRTNIRNTSTDQQLPWAFGLHPYFAFADRSRAKVTVPSPDIWDYTSDGPDKFRPAEGPLNLQAAEGTVLEGLNLDTVYTDRQRPEGNITCRLHDEAGGVEVAIAYDREVFPNTVVHSPDNEQKKADSVCMEPWTSVPDAFNLHIQGNPHSGLRTLAPQEEFTTEVTIAVSNLSKAGAGGTPTTLEKAKQLIRDVANDPEKTGTVKFDVEGLSTATFPLVSNAYLDDINDYLEQTAAKSPDGDKLILQQDKGGNNFIVTAYAEVFEGVVARSTGGRRRRDRGPMVWSRPMENEVTSEQLQELEWLLAWYIVHSKTPATLIWEATGTNELFRADNVSMRRDEANERLYCIEGNPRRWFTKRQVIHLGPTAKADAWLRTRPDIAERLTAAAAIGVVEDDENTANPERFRQVMQARKAKGLVTTIVTKSSGRPETGQIYSIDDMQFGTSLTKPPLNFQVRLYVLGKGSRDIPAPDFLYVGSEENAKGYLEVREENLRKLRAMTTSPPGQKRVYAPAEAIEIVGILRDFSDMRLGSVKYSAPGQEDDIGPLDMMKKIARLSPCGLLIVRIRVQKDTNIFDVFAEPVLVDDPVNMGVSSKTLSLFAGNDDEVWIQRGSGNIDGPARINEVTSQNVRYTLGATPAIMNIPIDDIRVAYLNRPGGPINSFSTAAAAAGYKTIAEIETAVFMNLRAIARQLMDAATVEEAQDVLGVNLANLDGIFTPADGIPGFEDIKEKTRPARDLLAEKAASAETTVAVEDAFEVYLNAVIGAVRETAGSDAYLNYAIPRVLDSTAGAAAETAVAEAKGRGDRGPSSFGRPPGAFGTRDIAREVPSREEELNVLIGNMHPQMSAADTKLCVIVTPGVVATGLPRLVSQMGFENITIVELSAEQMANIKGAAAEDLGEFLRTTAVDEAHPADSYRFCYMYSDDLQLNIKLTEIAPFDITMVLPETLLMNPLIYLRDAFGVTVADENLKSAQDALKAAQALATGV